MLNILFCDFSSENYRKLTSVKDMIYTLTHKQECLDAAYAGKPSQEVFDKNEPYRLEDTAVVYKEKNRDFVILNFADIHFSDFGYRVPLSLEGEMIIRRMIEETKPDLITLSGDIVCGERGENADYLSIRRITDIFESYQIPWAPIFGNHDDESNCDLNYLADTMMLSPHCLFKKGDPAMGVGNYVINIAEKDENGNLNVVQSLIMTDSHHSQPNALQAEWVKWCADGINALTDHRTQISVMMHIPLPEYEIAFNKYYDNAAKTWAEESKGCGERNESICCEHNENGEPNPNGFFDTLKAIGNVKYVFCSHDHMNDFSAEYEGIRLTYMMKLGKASGYQIGNNGATVITVGDNGVQSIVQKTVFGGISKELENIVTGE